MLFGAPTITAWRVEFNMASCCGSSNSSDESGAESSDVFSEADIASEYESVGSDDSDRSSDEEISALWTRVYPPELDDRVEDTTSAFEILVSRTCPHAIHLRQNIFTCS